MENFEVLKREGVNTEKKLCYDILLLCYLLLTKDFNWYTRGLYSNLSIFIRFFGLTFSFKFEEKVLYKVV